MEIFKYQEPVVDSFPVGDLWLIVGEPKVGKTRFCMEQWPDSYLIDTQIGSTYYKGNVACINEMMKTGDYPLEWHAMQAACKAIAVPENAGKTLVFDILDDVVKYTQEFAGKVFISENPDEPGKDWNSIDNGGKWGVLYSILDRFFMWCKQSGMTVVFVAHCKRLIVENENSVGKILDVPGKLAHQIPGKMDSIGIITKTMDDDGNPEREISFCAREAKGVSKIVHHQGSRHWQLNDKTFPLDYQALVAAFDRSE